jgi:hypothetical protein
MNITEKERAVLQAILNSDYGNGGEGETWEFDVSDKFVALGFGRESFAGSVSSTNKKGLTGSQEHDGGDWVIWLTDEGKRVANTTN